MFKPLLLLTCCLLAVGALDVTVVPRISPTSCGEANTATSKRFVERNFLANDEVDFLVQITTRGMDPISEELGGPTIMDPDQGLVLGPGGKVRRVPQEFSAQELSRYGQLLRRVHKRLLELHELQHLYHTAPTFIARLLAPKSGKAHQQQHVHDEYWHEHCDKNNTAHYDYSALVYLTEHGVNFTGGEFEFTTTPSLLLRPERGMLVTFASGVENPHRVHLVQSGRRIAWSTWWTCDAEQRFLHSKLRLEMDGGGEPRMDL